MKPKEGPAEYPPASYAGKQYVDSKGCVFIRAGFDGNVSWVPRLARNRSQVCGFQPSNVAGATSAPPAPSRRNAVQITAAAPETQAAPAPVVEAAPARTAAAAPARQPAPVAAKPAPKPAPARVAVRRPAPVAAPAPAVTGPVYRAAPQYAAPRIRVPAAPVAEAKPRVVAPAYAAPRAGTSVASLCGGLSPVGQQYMSRGTGGHAVRCGPQTGYTSYTGGAARVVAAPRVVTPSHAAPRAGGGGLPSYEKRAPVQAATGPRVFEVPAKPVTRVVRAQRTTQAYVSPQARVLPKPVYQERVLSQDVQVPKGYRRVWTDDRLNPRRAEQTLAGKRQMEMVWTQTVPRRLVPVEIAPQGYVAARAATPAPRYASPRVSTRNVAPKVQKAPISGRFVQVGSFRTPSNAQATAQRLAASGLPVQIRRTGSGQVVLAGPFSSDRAVGDALSAARRAGFAGAFPRN